MSQTIKAARMRAERFGAHKTYGWTTLSPSRPRFASWHK